mgnify:CR=1 FL=1
MLANLMKMIGKKFLLLLLFIPLTSFSQVIVDKKLGEIDIRTFSDKYITIIKHLCHNSVITFELLHI